MTRVRDEGVLGRWSRRKSEARAGDLEEEPREASGEPEAGALEELPDDGKSDDEILRELDLPDPDSMREGDDFKAFLRSEVPERLRRRALARLWRSHPLLATVDDLVEYGEDYTDAATVVENLQTAYRVGRGMLVPEREPPVAAAGDGSAEADSSATEEAAAAEHAPEGEAATAETAAGTEEETPVAAESRERPRRESMTFRFDGGEA